MDLLVFGLYFEAEMKAASCYVNDWAAEALKPFGKDASDREKSSHVGKTAEFCRKDEAVSRALAEYGNIEVVRTVLGKT